MNLAETKKRLEKLTAIVELIEQARIGLETLEKQDKLVTPFRFDYKHKIEIRKRAIQRLERYFNNKKAEL